MGFVSQIYANEPIIDEANAKYYAPNSDVIINGEVMTRGLELPLQKPTELPEGLKLSARKKHPRSEWAERVKDREKRGRILSKIIRNNRIPTSNQNGTNFCWTYGVVSAIVAKRAWRNMPYVEFSRESVAAPVKNYSNSGGWGNQALAYIVKYGIMPQDLWPRHHYRNSQYNTPANLEIAANYKVTEFEILPDNDFDATFSALLDDEAVAVGYNWWRHEVCGIDPVVIGSNSFGIRIWNSWTDSYGDQGMAILAESKATPDDAVVPIVFIGD